MPRHIACQFIVKTICHPSTEAGLRAFLPGPHYHVVPLCQLLQKDLNVLWIVLPVCIHEYYYIP